MTVRLRPHHLLCLLTYVGKGYSPAFVANYDRLAERLSQGEPVEIVAGPDDICTPVVDTPGSHCRNASVTERDRRAAEDVGARLGQAIETGTVLTLGREPLQALRRAFAAGRIRSACAGCEWNPLCTAIAAGGFEGARVTSVAPSPSFRTEHIEDPESGSCCDARRSAPVPDSPSAPRNDG